MSNPSVETAKNIAKRHGKDEVVVFWIHGGDYGYASYGRNPQLCNEAQKIADRLADWIESGHLIR